MTVVGKVVLVTGAASGIGRALVVGFTKDGARVAGFDCSESRLAETAKACDGKLLAVVGDITSKADVDHLVSTAMQHFGRIDVLFNNAGIANPGLLLSRPFDDWVKVIQVNLIGVALCTYLVLPGMLERGYGRIINVASRAAEGANANMSAYSASKAGVISFTKAVAREIDRTRYPDVLINVMIPGPTDTAIWSQVPASGATSAPRQLQPPEAVYPHARFLVEFPAGGPHGRIFWDSQDYAVYQRFND